MKTKPEKPNPRKPGKSNSGEVEAFYERTDVLPYLVKLIDDFKNIFPSSDYSRADSRRDICTLISRVNAEGVSFALVALPRLAEGLFQYLETGQSTYPGFRVLPGVGHPVFLRRLFHLAYTEGAKQVEAIKCIYQFSVAFKKLKGPYPKTVLATQLRKFIEVDAELAQLDFSSELLQPIVDEARADIAELLSGLRLESQDAKPRPGPGSTNDPVPKHLRFRPHVLYRQIDDVIPYVDEFHVHPWDCITTGWYNRLYREAVGEQRARFKFVHKTVGKPRGICIEQNETQFLQQKYKRLLYRYIESHPMTLYRIKFTDQSINADLALLSSVTGQDATIDMSEASDRVSRKLVSALFRGLDIHDHLMALSTKWIDFPKKYLEEGMPASMMTEKYAPMGSGLCFPVMTLVHWALCRAIIKLSMQPDDYRERVYVYGDDIILPTECIEAIFTYLPRFGMKLNMNKSFYRSKFRESCGIHAYNGVDITPVYFKHLPSPNPQAMLSSLQNEYDLRRKGFTHTANLLRTSLCVEASQEGFTIPDVPLVSGLFGFYSDNLDKPRTLARNGRGYDKWGNPCFRHLTVVPFSLEPETPPSEEECYLRYMLTAAQNRDLRERPEDMKLQWATRPILNHVTAKPVWLKKLLELTGTTNRPQRDKEQEKHYEHFYKLDAKQGRRSAHLDDRYWVRFYPHHEGSDRPECCRDDQRAVRNSRLRGSEGLRRTPHRVTSRAGYPCYGSRLARIRFLKWNLHPDFWVDYHLRSLGHLG